ncbi:MAG: hypothetical protein ACREIC_28240, partial [Limisphaerales bacterium]
VGVRTEESDTARMAPGRALGPYNGEKWSCSGKQRILILKIIEHNSLDKAHVEALAQDRFGESIKTLNRLEAGGLIDHLLTQVCGNQNWNQRRRFRPPGGQPGRGKGAVWINGRITD